MDGWDRTIGPVRITYGMCSARETSDMATMVQGLATLGAHSR